MKTNLFVRAIAFVLAGTLTSMFCARGQDTTTITYQGRLNQQDTHANGTFDFRFALYDLPEGGDLPRSGYVTNSAVLVSNDNSTRRVGVTLDFSRTTTVDDRVAIPGVTWLAETTRRRSLAISDSSAGYWFDLPLQAKPDSGDLAWSDWFPAPGQRASADVRGPGGFQVRWRVTPTR